MPQGNLSAELVIEQTGAGPFIAGAGSLIAGQLVSHGDAGSLMTPAPDAGDTPPPLPIGHTVLPNVKM